MTVSANEGSTGKWRIAHTEASAGWGGQEHRVLAELTGFQQRGSEVWLLAPQESKIFERARAGGDSGCAG